MMVVGASVERQAVERRGLHNAGKGAKPLCGPSGLMTRQSRAEYNKPLAPGINAKRGGQYRILAVGRSKEGSQAGQGTCICKYLLPEQRGVSLYAPFHKKNGRAG
jgi:hypothetical protein